MGSSFNFISIGFVIYLLVLALVYFLWVPFSKLSPSRFTKPSDEEYKEQRNTQFPNLAVALFAVYILICGLYLIE